MKKVIVHKSAVPIYIAAGAWAAYALLFPLYRVGHFAIAAAVSAAAASAAVAAGLGKAREHPAKTGGCRQDMRASGCGRQNSKSLDKK